MWADLFSLLPFEIVNHLKLVSDTIIEIRIRRGSCLCVTVIKEGFGQMHHENRELGVFVSDEMMTSIIKALTAQSLYSHENTLKEGYITVQGCYRVGVVGKVVCDKDQIVGLQSISALNIRLWQQIDGIGEEVYQYLKGENFKKSVLIFSPPNMGKTTILRDIVMSLTQKYPHKKVSLIDSRSEIAIPSMYHLAHLDILTNYPKAKGIEISTRVLSPDYIVCDEIGLLEEVTWIEKVYNCGVPYIMSAHGSSCEELLSHTAFFQLHTKAAFDTYICINRLLPNGRADFSFIPRGVVKL